MSSASDCKKLFCQLSSIIQRDRARVYGRVFRVAKFHNKVLIETVTFLVGWHRASTWRRASSKASAFFEVPTRLTFP